MSNILVWLRLIILVLVLLTILFGLLLSIIYLVKKNGKYQSNYLFSSLLFFTSLTLLHQFLFLIKAFDYRPQLYFIPIYFTFSIGPLLYFYIKSALFRGQYLTKKDLKHFILPIAQFSFFIFSFLEQNPKIHSIKNSIIFPYYGVFEKFIFFITVILYIYFAKKYVIKQIQNETTLVWERTNQFRLLMLLKISNYLFLLHGLILISDPLLFKFFSIDINNYKPTLWIHYLTLSSIVIWFVIWGYAQEFLIFLEGKKYKVTNSQLINDHIEHLIINEKLYLNSNLKASMLIKVIDNISAENIENIILREKKKTFLDWLDQIRYQQISVRKNPTKKEILQYGFRNFKTFYLQQKNN